MRRFEVPAPYRTFRPFETLTLSVGVCVAPIRLNGFSFVHSYKGLSFLPMEALLGLPLARCTKLSFGTWHGSSSKWKILPCQHPTCRELTLCSVCMPLYSEIDNCKCFSLKGAYYRCACILDVKMELRLKTFRLKPSSSNRAKHVPTEPTFR